MSLHDDRRVNMPIRLFLLVAVVASQPALADEKLNPVDLLLKARGLQAMETMEKLVNKNGDSRGKNLTKAERCTWRLESFYMAFAHPEFSKIVRKPAGMGMTAYNFPVMANDEGDMVAQIQYKYLPERKAPVLISVPLVKEGASVNLAPTISNTLSVATKDCAFMFPFDDPLKITVEAN